MIAAEALYDGAPLAHVVAFEERRRLARAERVGRDIARAAMPVRR